MHKSPTEKQKFSQLGTTQAFDTDVFLLNCEVKSSLELDRELRTSFTYEIINENVEFHNDLTTS